LSAGPSIAELVVAASPHAWAAAGFAVSEAACPIGSVRVRLAGRDAGRGVVAWSLRDVAGVDLDGLPTAAADGPPAEPAEHPNGALSIDHVVVVTPDLERTTHALEAVGVERRRVREAGDVVQGFFRLGEVILEVVQTRDAEGPARFWGMVVTVPDLDRCAELLGDRLGGSRDAVQPGRRIATVRREAELGPAFAFMTPDPRRRQVSGSRPGNT
jgi:hypothetical protein